MNKFHSYIDFKQSHPYAGTHPDFENAVTPVTEILDEQNKARMECFLPDRESKSA